MARKLNYLLGNGERLMESIMAPKKRGGKSHPYTFEQARENVSSMAIETVKVLDELPQSACPYDETVALVTLHPSYIAKTHYPIDLFNAVGLRPIGSRQREIAPKKWEQETATKNKRHKEHPQTAITAEIFVAGPRNSFRDWASSLNLWTEEFRGAKDLRKVEDLRAPTDRVRLIRSTDDAPMLEVVLHASGLPESVYILDGFREYMKLLDIKVNLDKRIHASAL